MPIHNIQTTEYECSRCDYKWLGRKNGKERDTLPGFCPRCKNNLWNVPYKHDMWKSKREELMTRAFSNERMENENMDEFAERIGLFDSKWKSKK